MLNRQISTFYLFTFPVDCQRRQKIEKYNNMSAIRGEFSSRFGFIMAAAGSAVGLGNIWGFPTQTASNGGAAFLVAYLVLAFFLAYPALMAELMIGRYGQANAVSSLQKNIKQTLAKTLCIYCWFWWYFMCWLYIKLLRNCCRLDAKCNR